MKKVLSSLSRHFAELDRSAALELELRVNFLRVLLFSGDTEFVFEYLDGLQRTISEMVQNLRACMSPCKHLIPW